MLNRTCLFVVALAFCAGCTVRLKPSTDPDVPMATFGDIERHEGSEIRISGVIKVGPHYICFVDPKFIDASDWPSEAGISLLNLEELLPSYEEYVGKQISIKGTYRMNLLPGGGALLNACGLSGIVLNEDQQRELAQEQEK